MESPRISGIPSNGALDDRISVALAPHLHPRLVSAGRIMCEAGQPVAVVHLIRQGLAKLTGPNGRTAALFPPGRLVGTSWALVGMPAPFAVAALTDCAVSHIPTALLKSLFDTDRNVRSLLLECLELEFRAPIDDITAFRERSGEERLQHLLETIVDSLPTDEEWIPVPFKKADLAHLVGVYPQSLSRILRKLKQKGIIREESQRKIFVNNLIWNKYK